MDKLTIEQKAKAYDEALERAKELLEVGLKDTRDKRVVLSFFPELAESEDEKMIKSITRLVKAFYDCNFPTPEGFERKDMLAWLEKQGQTFTKKDIDDAYLKGIYDAKQELEKQDEQKPTEWSEEDREYIESLLDIINGTPSLTPSEVECHKDWLKSLKDRVQPQPKQEWSEEDERIKNNLLSELTNLSVRKLIEKETEKKYSSWLKFLKDRYAFKPSGEQVEALEHFVRSIGESGYASPYDNTTKLLHSLLADLKKLREG